MYDACTYFYEEVFKIEFFGPLIIRTERYGKRVQAGVLILMAYGTINLLRFLDNFTLKFVAQVTFNTHLSCFLFCLRSSSWFNLSLAYLYINPILSFTLILGSTIILY